MTTSNTRRIVYTAIVSLAIIITSVFYTFTPNIILEDINVNRHEIQKLKITIINENKEGSGNWIELRCIGYQDFNELWWSGMTLLQPGKKHNFTLPTVSETDFIQVLCKYKGANGCMANKIKLMQNPSRDSFYCGEDDSRCAFSFKPDGLVEKEYIGVSNYTVGYVPTEERIEKCLGIDCFLYFMDPIIGEHNCCGEKCALW